MTFTYWGAEFAYEENEYNSTRLNERAVEIPIARAFIGDGVGLEVGNVLAHYQPVSHRVVDRYEEGAENIDVFDIDGAFDWIIAISTLEHVRWDEEPKDPDAAPAALRHLLTLLKPDGRMLVTVPFGWQPFLDTEIVDGKFEPARECSMVRDGDDWKQTEVEHRRYAATTRWAESVWIAEFR